MYMPILKCKTETVNLVEVDDLERFIKEATGHTYEIVPNEEWGNDEQHRIEVDGDLLDFHQENWDAFKSTGYQHQYRLQSIMNGLCADGHLQPGTYVVNVSW
jgi:hypothetical protein